MSLIPLYFYLAFRRLWQSNRRSQPTQEALQTLHQLGGVRIQTVDSIESTFTLDGVKVVDQDMLAIEQTPEHEGLCILISRASFSLAPDLCICGKLADILGMDVHTLFNFASQPPETIEQLMKIQNIPEIALPPQNQYNDPPGGPENPQSDDKDSNPAALGATNDQIVLDGSQLANGLQLILHNDASCSIRDVLVLGPMVDDQPKATHSIDSTGLGATMDASEYIAKASESTAISARNNHPPIPITGDHILNGVLGESFVSTFDSGSYTLTDRKNERSILLFLKSCLDLVRKTGQANGVPTIPKWSHMRAPLSPISSILTAKES